MLALAMACAHVPLNESSRMSPLGPALTKLTAAADASIAYEHPAKDLDETALLKFTTSYDPTLLEPFEGYAVRLIAEDLHAIILICDAKRTRALFEDVGCTMGLDRSAWQELPPPPCAFTLHVKTTCDLPVAPTIDPR